MQLNGLVFPLQITDNHSGRASCAHK